jgi:hypothetical protein
MYPNAFVSSMAKANLIEDTASSWCLREMFVAIFMATATASMKYNWTLY